MPAVPSRVPGAPRYDGAASATVHTAGHRKPAMQRTTLGRSAAARARVRRRPPGDPRRPAAPGRPLSARRGWRGPASTSWGDSGERPALVAEIAGEHGDDDADR